MNDFYTWMSRLLQAFCLQRCLILSACFYLSILLSAMDIILTFSDLGQHFVKHHVVHTNTHRLLALPAVLNHMARLSRQECHPETKGENTSCILFVKQN